MARCKACNGTGTNADATTCDVCHGGGHIFARRTCPQCFGHDIHATETGNTVTGRCLDCDHVAHVSEFATGRVAPESLTCVVCGRAVDAREMSTHEPARFYTFPESLPDADAAACVADGRAIEPEPVDVDALQHMNVNAVRFFARRERVVCCACAKTIQRDMETPRRHTCNVCGVDALPRDTFRDQHGNGHVCRACFRFTYTIILRARVRRAARALNGYEPNAATLPHDIE